MAGNRRDAGEGGMRGGWEGTDRQCLLVKWNSYGDSGLTKICGQESQKQLFQGYSNRTRTGQFMRWMPLKGRRLSQGNELFFFRGSHRFEQPKSA